MIKGIGIDTVEIKRIAKSIENKSFIEKCFTPNEIANLHGDEATYYATRFAGKEAVFKASKEFKNFLEIEVLNHKDGSPYVSNVKNAHISITTEAGLATAICIIEE